MKELFKIIKKFIWPILFTIIFLIVQAELELSLPDYTAKIINVGIQEKGIGYAVPEVLKPSVFDALVKVSNNDELISNAYELKKKSDYTEAYKDLESEELYFLKDSKKEDKDNLEKVTMKDFMFVLLLSYDNEEMKQSLPVKVPDGVSLMDFYNSLSLEQQMEMKNGFLNTLYNYDESMVKQMAVEEVKNEYSSMGINLDNIQMKYIYHNGFIMVMFSLLLMLSAVFVGFMASRIATKFGYLLRQKIVSKVMSFSAKEFNQFSVASLITRSTNDIQQVQMLFIVFFRIIIFAPILGFGALFKVLGNSMNWVLALAIGLIILLIIFLFIFAMPKFKMIQKLVDKLNLVTRERLNGVPVIRAFGTANFEEKKFAGANEELSKTILFCDRVMGIMMPTITFIMNGVAILIIWVGAKDIELGSLQVGTLMAFITYAMQVIMSFLMISMVSIMLPRALISIKRICEVLNTKNSIIESDNPKEFKNHNGVVEFKNVSFKYPSAKEEVLSDISFKASAGMTTAIVGGTGSGKSTLVNLILRFFDVTSGEIKVDGINIKDANIHELRDLIGYVPQKGNLFFGTVRSNVMFGKNEEDTETLKEALEVAQASEFVNELPLKYEASISQGGTNVSGGQRQRLSIARAIAKKPEIYIFDDSFSALDFKTDKNLRESLHNYTCNATIFIVAQRISTILAADQIIVLDKGKIVGIGKHKDLLKNCEVYKEIALSQLKESELNA